MTATSSINEISMDQLGNGVVWEEALLRPPPLLYREPKFFNFNGAQESIPRNQIPPAYVAWRDGTTTLFLLGSWPPQIVSKF